MKLKKIAIAVIATMTMATGAMGITANAFRSTFPVDNQVIRVL